MKNLLNKETKGITLIALVITIVILIILAGVLVNLTLGENGLFTRSKLEKIRYEYAAAKEIVDIKLVDIQAECMTEGEEYTLDIIADRIGDDDEISTDIIHFYATAKNKSDNERPSAPSSIKGMLVSANQYPKFKFLIGEEGNVVKVLGITTGDIPTEWPENGLPTGIKTLEKFEEEIGANAEPETTQGGQTGGETQTTDPIVDSAPKIKFAGAETGVEIAEEPESLKDYYTKIVDDSFFSSIETEGWDWQLFYDDEDYIYLIASDYVQQNILNASSGKLRTETTPEDTNYTATFCSNTNYNDYVFNGAPNDTYKDGAASTAITSNPLTQKYLKYAGIKSQSKNVNMKTSAFMMDTDNWSNFAGNKYSNTFAIGGPTIELFVKSYNAKHETKLANYYDNNGELLTESYDNEGYKIKWDVQNASWGDTIENLDSTNANGDTKGNMWVRNTNEKAYGMWLASPSSLNEVTMSQVHCTGGLFVAGPDNTSCLGFRPVVCIPKESI